MDLTKWEPETDHPGFNIMLGVITEIAGPSQLKAKEAKKKRIESIPDTAATTGRKFPEHHKTSYGLKFVVSVGAAVLLIAGIWWLVSQQPIREVRQEMEKLDRQFMNLENAVAKFDKPEQIEELYRQRDTLSQIIESFSEQATKAGLESQLEQYLVRLEQIQILLANKEKEFDAQKGRIVVKTVPENASVEILNIDEPFQQEMELKPGEYHFKVSSEGYEPQDRLIELGPGEEKPITFELEKIAPKAARLYVETVPENANVKILNIEPKFVQGMELEPRSYHLQVGTKGYETERRWIELGPVEEKRLYFELRKIIPRIARLYVETTPEDAAVRILNIKPAFSQGMELEPGNYHVEVAAEGYVTVRRWIDLKAAEEEPFKFELVKIEVAEPAVTQVVSKNHPRIPPGLKIVCLHRPDTLDRSSTCPVIRWNGYTYWAYSHGDNRLAMTIVAYDDDGNAVQRSYKRGARYVWRITVSSTANTVTFWGQSNEKIVMGWDELKIPSR